jgi:GT2 family glycosyltransferase
VVATRVAESEFAQKTALGRSLNIYSYPFVEVDIYAANSRGLPEVYNQSIEQAKDDPAILVFAHDDIHLSEFFWPDRMLAGLEMFGLCGIAGNKRRLPKQPSWIMTELNGAWDQPEHLTGVIGHGPGFPPNIINFYGAPFQEVKLLDGVLLMAHSDTLHAKGLRFDQRFDFHLYDMDFCRSAEQLGVTMGTIALSLVHDSGGDFFSESWRNNFNKYLQKWGE